MISIARAVAPVIRIWSKKLRTECEPSMSWSPYFLSPIASCYLRPVGVEFVGQNQAPFRMRWQILVAGEPRGRGFTLDQLAGNASAVSMQPQAGSRIANSPSHGARRPVLEFRRSEKFE